MNTIFQFIAKINLINLTQQLLHKLHTEQNMLLHFLFVQVYITKLQFIMSF